MKKYAYWSLFLLLVACRNSSPSSSNVPSESGQINAVQPGQLPAGFMDFYDKFHTDSLFQVAHIAWPLQGETTEQVDSTRARRKLVQWEPAKWRMHRKVDFSTGEFKQEWEMMGSDLVIEFISYRAANFGLERRFVKREDGDWELIYYADMQER